MATLAQLRKKKRVLLKKNRSKRLSDKKLLRLKLERALAKRTPKRDRVIDGMEIFHIVGSIIDSVF
jgi:hypothetical protein